VKEHAGRAKQRTVEDISRRRQMVAALTSLAGERNPDLHVLGMSATPVINNLQEGKSMVELVSGVAHDERGSRRPLARPVGHAPPAAPIVGGRRQRPGGTQKRLADFPLYAVLSTS
jgi:hypothetical protein